MNRLFFSGFIILFLLSPVGFADEISSSIQCDGATWVSSSVQGQDEHYSGSFFTTDLSSLMRILHLGDSVEVFTSQESSGPMGIDEYSDRGSNASDEASRCMFTLPGNVTVGRSEIMASDLLSGGRYVSSRERSDVFGARFQVNGSGLLLTRAVSDDGNRTVRFGSDVGGMMNVTERMVLGD